MQLPQSLTILSLLLGITHSAALATVERTSPPSGCLTVGTSGKYSTFGAAIAALTGNTASCIFLYPGTYHEQVIINYSGSLTIYGSTTDVSSYSANTVSIESKINSQTAGNNAKSSAIQVSSSNVKFYNINVKNSYGQGSQAVALTVTGDKVSFYGCGFFGYQDTLYAKTGQQYYKNCYIEGAVDYIFGRAPAWFTKCTLASVGGGAITANNRADTADTTWYVIDSSKIVAKSGVNLVGKVYLGRPWGVQARVIYQNSALSNIINANGWTTMAEGATPVFEEFKNSGDGSNVSARKFLTKATAAVTLEQLFGNAWTQWVDTTY